ncbi:MAG: DNA primase [bacterium]|nr:DNA primase [bacterium]
MDTVDLVKEKIDVVDFIGEYIRLKGAGKNFKGLCPFHKEKTPSFVVSADRQVWHCFGCSRGGDVISFLMQYENLEFIEALKILADRAGVNMQLKGSRDQKQFTVLYDINRLAAKYYQAALASSGAKSARDYLEKRGLKKETLEEFQIGVSGADPDKLIKFLTKKGYKIADIERAGLAVKTQSGTYRDRFRQRIMFPLFDHFGKIIGFTGRLLPEAEHRKELGKYINSPETPIYNKSKVLFGFHLSKNDIREKNSAILVEGQMDLIMLYQSGVKNAVASSGTAFTAAQLSVIRKRADKLILAFDSDSAGLLATERAIDSAWENDFEVKVVIFDSEEKEDPADIVAKDPKRMEELLESAVPAIKFYLIRYQISPEQEISAKKKGLRKILERIKYVKSPVEQNHYLEQLGQESAISQDLLVQEMEAIKNRPALQRESEIAQEQKQAPDVKTAILNRLITLSVMHGLAKKILKEKIDELPKDYQQIFAYLCEESKEINPSLKEVADSIQLRSSMEPLKESKLDDEMSQLLERLKTLRSKDLRNSLRQKIQEAENSGDEAALEKYLQEYRDANV